MKQLLSNPGLPALRESLKDVDALMRNGILTDEETGLKYYSGYQYRTLYDWDQYFEAILQIYMGWDGEYIKNGVLLFLMHQKESGFIARSVPSTVCHEHEHVKPFLCRIAGLVIDAYGDADWVLNDGVMTKLKRYLDYWLIDMDRDRNGLSEWESGPHTGMDNQHERAGYWRDHFCEGVDLNSYLVMEAQAFADLAEKMGRADWAREYREIGRGRAQAMQRLWDDQEGFFFDRNMRHGEPMTSEYCGWGSNFNNVAFAPNPSYGQAYLRRPEHPDRIYFKYSGAFLPLYAGVATDAQAERMVNEHLLNENEFWTAHPVTSVAKCEEGYRDRQYFTDLGCNWRATTWIPLNYMIYHGLRRYGFRDAATALAGKTAQLVRTAGNREWYDTATGEGRGLDPFWGWSLLGHFIEWEDSLAAL
ncbi:MAG: hypothetical protein GX558_08390 [Clostridiales bacterium]|nr:hypothetical protein [Clostridiales bacterium]